MRFSSFVDRIAGEGSQAWAVHNRALALRAEGRDVILLSVGDPDLDTPAPIVARLAESVRAGRTHYTPIAGEPALRRAIAGKHRRITGQQVEPGQVVVVPGAQCGLFATAQCLLEPGCEAILFDPAYTTYEAVIEATGARPVRVRLEPERGFHFDPAALAAAVTPRTRAILMNSPHNPTGAVATRAEVEAVAEACRAHDLWLISDEVYAGLTFERPHLSPCALPGMAERTAVVSSLSKSHAMTGWRLGWVVGPPALAEHLGRLLLCMLYGLPPFIQDAAVTALATEVADMRALYRRRRDLVCDRLAQLPGLVCHRPESGMFAMLDVRPTGLSAADFAGRLLDQQAVSLLPGDGFGPAGRGHVRLCLAAPEPRLLEACERIARFLGSLARAEGRATA